MEQALLNIVKNAMEAVDTTMRETGATSGHVYLELAQDQGQVRLSVIDSGGRLGEVPACQLLTPFFSPLEKAARGSACCSCAKW